MTERTDTTSGYQLIPELQDVVFIVSDVPIKKKSAKKHVTLYQFLFSVEVRPGVRTSHFESFPRFADELAQLLRALGFVEYEKGKFEWELRDAVGKRVVADIIHEPDRNDPKRLWAQMKNIRPYQPKGVQPKQASQPPQAPILELQQTPQAPISEQYDMTTDCTNRNKTTNSCNVLHLDCAIYGMVQDENNPNNWNKCQYFRPTLPF